MAETKKAVIKKKGLPPLSPKPEDDGDTEAKPVKKRPKKKIVKSDANGDITEEKNTEGVTPAVKKRKKRTQSQNRESEPEIPADPPADGDAPVTPKKKKKRKPKAAEDGADENQNEAGDGKKKDAQGSKTSLLSKNGETPRKKGVKKKKKKVAKSPAADDEYGESQWAEDLRTLEDDILPSPRETTEKDDGGDDEEEMADTVKPTKMKTTFLAGPMLKSQPLDKIFVESSRKFKGLNKSTLNKQIAEETVKAEITPVVTRKTTIDFALTSHLIFRVVSLFLHGLTAGLCMWQMVNIFTLTTFPNTDFLLHYRKTAMPLQCVLYFLLSLCLVSACDRFDIGNPMPRFLMRAFTLQNGAVSIVFYLIALILNVVTIKYEDKIYLYEEPSSSDNATMDSGEIDTFKSLNSARSIFALLGWFVLSITPNADRLGKNLKSGETGLENELQMDGVSAA